MIDRQILANLFDPGVTELGRLPMTAPPAVATGRSTMSLDGRWAFRLIERPGDAPPGWVDEPTDAPPWRPIDVPGVWTRQETGDLPHYTNVVMPWDAQPPGVPIDNPTGLYRSTFSRPTEPRAVVTFGGAESMLLVWCNGRFVGMGKDSRLASSFDLTDHLTDGDNRLAVMVPRWSDATWIEDQDHWFHGGLHRPVTLTGTARTRIDDLVVSTDFDASRGTASLRAAALVGAPGRIDDGWRVTFTLADATGELRKGIAEVAVSPAAEGLSAMAAAYRYLGPEARIELDDLAVRPWSAESPTRYRVTAALVDPNGRPVEEVTHHIGFRRVEIVDRRLLVNGAPVLIAGVNRHDHDPETGKTVTVDEMRAELVTMKRHNVNAVRTSHYPNDPALLDLCDELGLYVVDEANVEAHARHDSLARSGRYDQAILDRIRRMVRRDRSHPCVIGWSLGNESGRGAVHDAAAAWIRAVDPTRFVHYEGALHAVWTPDAPADGRQVPPDRSDRLITDVVCPMYATVDQIRSWAAWAERTGLDDRPLILCEYSHAMGNSNGGLADYWDAFRSEPALGGGFVWDWRDQGLAETAGNGRPFWAYGGHFGDKPNDANFCINGLTGPDGSPHPALAELAWLARPVAVRFDHGQAGAGQGVATVENRRHHLGIDDVTVRWELAVDGRPVAAATLDVPPVEPGGEVDVPLALPGTDDPAHATTLTFYCELTDGTSWAEAGHRVGHDQTVLMEAPAADPPPLPVRRSASSPTLDPMVVLDGIAPTLWRAPTDNDGVAQGWTAPFTGVRPTWLARDLDTLHVTDDQRTERRTPAPDGDLIEVTRVRRLGPVNHRSVATVHPDRRVRIDEELTTPDDWHDLPRVGVTFDVDTAYQRLRWFGPGPDETYPDRRAAALIGRWESTARDQYHPYVVPQEHGAHMDCRWFELIDEAGVGIRVVGAPRLIFSARRHTDRALTDAATVAELSPADHIEVHVDAAIRGLGTAACGPDTDHIIRAGTHRWTWWMVPVGGA